MSTTSTRAKFDTALETAFGSITSTFTQVGGVPLPGAYRIVFVQNLTNQTMDFSISYSGLTTTFSLLSNDKIAVDVSANGNGGTFQTAAGEGCWVKYRSVAPTSGFVQFFGIEGA